MNRWTQLSIQYANQRSYLDDLFQIYPTIPEGIRDIDEGTWSAIEGAFNRNDNQTLMRLLLSLPLFPIKDSYVAYLKRDSSAIERNPLTIARLCGRIHEMGLSKLFEKCSEPKETNRQLGPMFRAWLQRGCLGIQPVPMSQFIRSTDNAILDAGDAEMQDFACSRLNYSRNKGLDFLGRFNGHYVIGEAKFLTDFGGHQNAQFADAMSTLHTSGVNAIVVAILDGVLYIPGNHKLYNEITSSSANTMSALVFRDFLYSITR